MERLKTNSNTTSVSFKTLTEDLNFSENLDAMEYEKVFVNHQRWLTKSWSNVKATHKLRFLLLFHKCYNMHICFVSCVVFLFRATGVELKLAWFSKASLFFSLPVQIFALFYSVILWYILSIPMPKYVEIRWCNGGVIKHIIQYINLPNLMTFLKEWQAALQQSLT